MRESIQKVVTALIVAALCAVGGAIWSTRDEVRDRPTRSEVIQLIADYAPYGRDRLAIEQRLQHVENQDAVLINALNNNTAAIQDLRVQMERLLVVKPADVLEELSGVKKTLERALRDRE
ncbi:MAG: hypothetical protein ACF8XB_09745 [Planctomycetota bacterium JB042]